MAKRKIIRINEDLCNGCGECVTSCAEGALKIVNGKAKLVKEQFCDGFGDCIGECPTGALTIEEREADAFDFAATREHVAATEGPAAVARFDEAGKKHGLAPSGGCPGMRMRVPEAPAAKQAVAANAQMPTAIPSELQQWPVQLHLVQPGAPFFKNRELVVMSTCGPIASADIHWRFLRGRGIVVACPKLDRTEGYVEKMADIFSEPTIPKVIVVRMQVPCCGGLTMMVLAAAERCGRRDLVIEEAVMSLTGDVLSQKAI